MDDKFGNQMILEDIKIRVFLFKIKKVIFFI